MKIRSFQAALLVGVMMLAASAFAVNKGSLEVNNAVSVNGTQLQAGDYSVTWDGNGPDVQISILKGKKVVAQTAAKVVTMDQASGSNQAVLTRNADGSASLSEIRFSGKKYALDIVGSASGSGSSN